LKLSRFVASNLSRRSWLQLSSLSILELVLPLACQERPHQAFNSKRAAAPPGLSSALPVPQRHEELEAVATGCASNGEILPIGAQVPFDENDRAFGGDRDQFEPKHKAHPGEWLARFHESGLSFNEYVALRPTGPRGERTVIVLQPLGAFTPREMNELKRLAEYTEAFFYQPVRIASPAPLPRKGQRVRQDGGKTWVQHHAAAVLDTLADSLLPKDAICTLGVTLGDLYPEPAWNYVFGEATLSKRVGVYSLARYQAKFWGAPDTAASRRLAMLRSFKVLAHEAGHMFSMVHCRRFECLMNGSNSLEEMDRQTLELCPVCLKMLQYNLRFDVRSRYRRLLAIYERENLVAQRDWVTTRLARIGCAPAKTALG